MVGSSGTQNPLTRLPTFGGLGCFMAQRRSVPGAQFSHAMNGLECPAAHRKAPSSLHFAGALQDASAALRGTHIASWVELPNRSPHSISRGARRLQVIGHEFTPIHTTPSGQSQSASIREIRVKPFHHRLGGHRNLRVPGREQKGTRRTTDDTDDADGKDNRIRVIRETRGERPGFLENRGGCSCARYSAAPAFPLATDARDLSFAGFLCQ